jgi:hypothetical protein
MYFADIGSSLELSLKVCAGWGAQSIMPENYWDGNVEKMGSCQCQLPVARKTKSPNRLAYADSAAFICIQLLERSLKAR